MGQDLIIHLDYQELIKRLKLAWRAKDILCSPYYFSHEPADFIKANHEYSPLEGGMESVYFTLEGDGPFFVLGNRTLRMASTIIKPFKFKGVGSTINLNGLRLKVVGEYYHSEYLVMLPSAWAAIFYYLLPIPRWFDKIYRRLILTAAVWGLADCPAAEIPYWGHLKWSKEYKRAKNENRSDRA